MVLSCTNKQLLLQAETSEDLLEWKAALEEALANAPSAANGIGQDGGSKNDQPDASDSPKKECKFYIHTAASHVYRFT